jgi:hypothetical protein
MGATATAEPIALGSGLVGSTARIVADERVLEIGSSPVSHIRDNQLPLIRQIANHGQSVTQLGTLIRRIRAVYPRPSAIKAVHASN